MREEGISELIRERAKVLGFQECRMIPARFLSEEKQHLEAWLEQGMHGEMGYMSHHMDKRLDPRLLVQSAKTIIVLLHNYYTTEKQSDPQAPVVSRYAFGKDYHQVIRRKLQLLLRFIRELKPGCSGRVFTDSAPVLERAWALRAGLGWIGRNSCLISPLHGSFVFIGEVILDTELSFDKEITIPDRCGTCIRCTFACPTGAIISPKTIDARLCIAYQTIEKKGKPDAKLRGRFANRVFGCDICQEVCPWNRKASGHHETEYLPSPDFLGLTAAEWAQMDMELFDRLFTGTAVQRTGYDKLKSNMDFLSELPENQKTSSPAGSEA
jgi:epoxyqueuosine reductase